MPIALARRLVVAAIGFKWLFAIGTWRTLLARVSASFVRRAAGIIAAHLVRFDPDPDQE